MPEAAALAERLGSVLAVLYLIFNQGWSSAEGAAGSELCAEAIRLARALASLLPAQAEAQGLLALMQLHHARRAARVVGGDFVPLELQDAALWRWEEIRAGLQALSEALGRGPLGPYGLQAAISALHIASRAGEPRWREIAALYACLEEIAPSPVVSLNRSVAVARAEGPDAGLALLARLGERAGERLEEYAPYHAARADLLRRSGRAGEAAAEYRRARELTPSGPERRHLERRLAELERALH